jgi:hypothetical protein
MSRRRINRTLSIANPIDGREVEALDLDRAERELLSDIAAAPQDGDANARPAGAPRGGGLWRERTVTRFLTFAGAVACATVAFLAFNGGVVLDGGGVSPAKPESAYAAELERIAKHSEVVMYAKPAPIAAELKHSEGSSSPVPVDGWHVIPTIWDCTEIPCVKKTPDELDGTGYTAPEVKTKHGGEVAIVIPPRELNQR